MAKKWTDSIEGPVTLVGGSLVLRVPLSEGGDKLVACSRGWGHVEGDCLEIVVPPWLVERLQIKAGSLVIIGNDGGGLAIMLSDRQVR